MSKQRQEVAFRRHTNTVYFCAAAVLLLAHLPRTGPYHALEGLLDPLRALVAGKAEPAPITLVRAASAQAPEPVELARLVGAAQRAGASAIGLEYPAWRSPPTPAAATPLVDAMRQSGRVVLSVGLDPKSVERRLIQAPEFLKDAAEAGAYTHVRPDLLGKPREMVLSGLTKDRSLYGAPVELFRLQRKLPAFNVLKKAGTLRIKPLPGQEWEPLVLTLDGQGGVPIDGSRLGNVQKLKAAALNALPADTLKDRIVILDTASPEHGPGPGAHVAAVLASMLEGRVPAPLPWVMEAVCLALLALVLTAIGYLREPRVVAAATGLLLGLWLLGGLGAYAATGLLLPLGRGAVLLLLLGVAGWLRHVYRPIIGVKFEARNVGGDSQKEAQAALQLGIKLLQQGQVDESIKYFQKVARIESSMQGRSQYFLSLVLLRRGETETASTLVSGMDFASLTRDDAYQLADELERRGALDTAHTLYGKLAEEASDFKDVAERLVELEQRLSSVSEEEIAEMMVRKVIDRRFGEIEMVGRGGMGFVYKGADARREGTEVALKILSPLLANHEEIRIRFLQEAKLASELAHPNIVRIFDVFEKSLPYYSMEFIGSLSVKEILAGVGNFPIDDALELAMQTCEGLHAAHEHGVVHRDIKPENLMLDENAQVKVIDFGIAKVMEGGDLTATRKRMGTPEYMSPEQITAQPIDRRSDVYSFGIVLYEILSGSVPFSEIRQHISDPLPSLDPELEIPPELEQVIRKATAKNAESRHGTMAELRDELGRVRESL